MKSAILLLLCCALLTACDHIYTEAAHKPEPLFTPHTANLAQQKLCEEQAAKRYDEFSGKGSGFVSGYVSHLDASVNVCYVRIDNSFTSKAGMSLKVIILDAFEGREYAGFQSAPKSLESLECHINIPGKSVIGCNSQVEFDQLTEKYFGIGE